MAGGVSLLTIAAVGGKDARRFDGRNAAEENHCACASDETQISKHTGVSLSHFSQQGWSQP